MDGSTYTGRSLVHEVYEGDVVSCTDSIFVLRIYFRCEPFRESGAGPGTGARTGPGACARGWFGPSPVYAPWRYLRGGPGLG